MTKGGCTALLLTASVFAAGGQVLSQARDSSAASPQAQAEPAPRVRVSSGIISGLILKKIQPSYPEEAKKKRIQGVVILDADISKDGDVTRLSVISGDPLLAQPAMDAVRQWKYKPYLRNGQALDIDTQVQIDFTLTSK